MKKHILFSLIVALPALPAMHAVTQPGIGLGKQLLEAAQAGDAARGQQLIDQGATLDERDAQRRTALMIVADGGDASFVQALVKAGADLTAKDNGGNTVLMYAAPLIASKAFSALLNAGAKATIDAQNKDGWTASMYAARWGNGGNLQILIDRDANLTLKNSAGKTAYEIATRQPIKAQLQKAFETKQQAHSLSASGG